MGPLSNKGPLVLRRRWKSPDPWDFDGPCHDKDKSETELFYESSSCTHDQQHERRTQATHAESDVPTFFVARGRCRCRAHAPLRRAPSLAPPRAPSPARPRRSLSWSHRRVVVVRDAPDSLAVLESRYLAAGVEDSAAPDPGRRWLALLGRRVVPDLSRRRSLPAAVRRAFRLRAFRLWRKAFRLWRNIAVFAKMWACVHPEPLPRLRQTPPARRERQTPREKPSKGKHFNSAETEILGRLAFLKIVIEGLVDNFRFDSMRELVDNFRTIVYDFRTKRLFGVASFRPSTPKLSSSADTARNQRDCSEFYERLSRLEIVLKKAINQV